MAEDDTTPEGPDLAAGVALADFTDGRLLGRVGDDEVLLVQSDGEIFALAAHCTHYGGPLAEGVVHDGCIHCPWHHARFALASGEAIRSPAFDSLTRWQVERDGDRVRVTGKLAPAKAATAPATTERIVIVGGGAAGFAAAEMLNRRGFKGHVTILSADADVPVDRPNLSKDFLAGTAPASWMPLRPAKFYDKAGIDLRLNTVVGAIDPEGHTVTLKSGESIAYDKLLLATGAEPVRLPVEGAAEGQVHVLRTMADCKAIIEAAGGAKTALVIGASFIGLEVAASLRTRELEVHVVAPDVRPMERVLGPQMGDFVRALHEEHGVNFHLEDIVSRVDGKKATLRSGTEITADLIIAGVGVRPRLDLAEAAGLRMDRGVVVNANLQTSHPDIYAAGDIARWPDRHTGQNIRAEHWVVATHQGQIAAENMMGKDVPYDAAPFFWSQHYDVPINYVGHAEKWDTLEIDGSIKDRDCVLRYKDKGRTLAVVSVYRDRESIEAELELENMVV